MRKLALGSLLLVAPLAQALECGAVLERDARLTSDLNCPGDGPALTVRRAGIQIDLNGFSLRGSGRGTGILVKDAAAVTLTGPGSIEGFTDGVETLRAPRLIVDGIDFRDLDSGLLLHNSFAAEVRNNRFEGITGHAVSSKALPEAEFNVEGGHRIVDNQIANAGFGLHLCGYDSGGSLLQGNRMSDISQIALLIEDGADDNRIVDNRIERSTVAGIALRGSSGNALLDNQLQGGRVGISLVPQAGPGCVSRSPAMVTANRIEDNLLSGHQRAFAFGQQRPRGPIGPNRIRNNVVVAGARTDLASDESEGQLLADNHPSR
jgi:parallel beta-helix repeat protein